MDATTMTLVVSFAPFGGTLPPAQPGVFFPRAGPEAGLLLAAMLPAFLGITDFLGDSSDEAEDTDDDVAFEDDDGLGELDEFDDVDEFDDGGGDGFGGGEDQAVNELENRIDEIENEVASLSSSVNTVQTENEAVSETVQDIEENVRDLLEIYEMVTRGVNPFVDDTTAGAMGGGSDSTFGLFDDDGGEEAADVDESIADADAEEFFDDDFDDPDESELATPDDAAVVTEDDDLGGDDLGGDDLGGDDLGGDDDDSGDGGEDKSFAELKEEYESGEAGWDVDDPLEDGEDEDSGDDAGELMADDGEDSGDDAGELMADDGEDPAAEADSEDAFNFGTTEAADSEPAEPAEPAASDDDGEFGAAAADSNPDPDPDPDSTPDPDPNPDPALAADPSPSESNHTTESADAGSDDDVDPDDRTHLQEFPDGYVADLTALEWLEFLIDVGGTGGARDALGYYADVDWISPSVEDQLRAFLAGIPDSEADTGSAGPAGLDRFDPEHHRRSLAFVAELAGDGDRAAVPSPAAESIEVEGAAPDGGRGIDPTGGEADGI